MVKISRDYLHLFFWKKLLLKKFLFSLSHVNKSKNYPISLKFGTDVAFIYHQIESFIQKIGPLRKKIFEIKNLKKKILNRVFSENTWFIDLKFQPVIALIGWYMWLKLQEMIFICFLEKNYFWKNFCFRCRTIRRAKIIQSSWNLVQI